MAHLYAAALRSYGSPAHVQTGDDPLTELDAGEVMIVPGFTGRLLARFEPDAAARSAAQVYRTMVSALPEGVAAGDYTTSAEDKPALAVTEATADAWGGRDVTAAVRHCDEMKVGWAPMCLALRPSGRARRRRVDIQTAQRYSPHCGRGRSTPRGRRPRRPTFPPSC